MTRLIAFALVVASIAIAACKTEGATSTVSIASPPQPTESASAVKGTLLPPSVGSRGADDAYVADSDCTWGEIPHEILASTDCMCLFGCPSLAQNKTVEARRTSQHARLCKPGWTASATDARSTTALRLRRFTAPPVNAAVVAGAHADAKFTTSSAGRVAQIRIVTSLSSRVS